jgi:predicted lactoylglutathione lyase
MDFFSKLGFTKTFTKRELCDTTRHSEALLALSCESRAEVDEMVNAAIAAGGKRAMGLHDYGFMYAWSF